MSNVGLIPYTVQTVLKDTKVIPPGVKLIEAPAAWEHGYLGNEIVIAVLDTGCDPTHLELKKQIIAGRNFTTDNHGDPAIFDDGNGHGTHVCGTICAERNNEGIIGVAPMAKLLILKVLNNRGNGELKWVIEGIRYALKWRGPNGERVRIISMSLGGRENSRELHVSIQEAIKQQILVVCAAGNEGDGSNHTDEFAYPGAYPEVVQVGSVNMQRRISSFSNSNREVDLVAPGEDIVSTYPNNQFAVLSGTSMAAPHVSAAAALIIEQCEKEFERTITEPEIYAQLIKRTVSLTYSRRLQGNGIINLASGYTSL